MMALGGLWSWGREMALISARVQWSYADLAARVLKRVQALRAQGLQVGQVVRVSAAPVSDLVVMQHALDLLGCGLLPVSPRRDAAELMALERQAGVEWRWLPDGDADLDPDSDPDAAPASVPDRECNPDSGRWERAGAGGRLVATGVSGEPVSYRAGYPLSEPGLTPPSRSPNGVAPALVIETSGSSGAPKAVMLTRANVLASASATNAQLGLGPGDAWLGCLPRCHVGGLMIGFRCALAGAVQVAHEGYDADAVARDLVERRISHLSLVPPMLARLLAILASPPPWLRVVLVGGQGLSTGLARKALEVGWPLRLTYGMTETCSHVVLSPPLRSVPPAGWVGRPLPGVEMQCSGTPTAPARMRIRGPQVMAGYAEPGRQPGLGLEEGWFQTSDLGYLSPEGEVTVSGRADQILVIGGEAVVPSRVEERLLAAPGLEAVAVVALPDPTWGHRLVAAYTGDTPPEALETWCRRHLPDRQRPRGFHRCAALPILASGKLDAQGIRALFADLQPAGGGADIRSGQDDR